MNPRVILLFFAVGLGVAAWVLFFRPSDRQIIHRQVERIEETGALTAAEPPVEALVRAGKIAEHFQDPCRLIIEEAGYDQQVPRRQLIERVAALRGRYSRMEADFADLAIEILDPGNARMGATLRVRGMIDGQPAGDVREVEARWVKVEGIWRIAEIRVVQVLER